MSIRSTVAESTAPRTAPGIRREQARIGAREALPTLALLVFIVVGWDYLVHALNASPLTVPTPAAVATAFQENLPAILENTLVTLNEAVLGFLLGNVVAVLVAVVFTYSALVRTTAYPILLAVQAIPLISLAPLLNVWLGPGTAPKVLLAAFLAGTVMLVNMVQGLSSADEETMELMHTLGTNRWQELKIVRFPAAQPFFFTSLKLGASSAIVAAIAAEYIGSLSGLGYLLIQSKQHLDTGYLWAVVLVVAVIGMSVYGLVALLERRFLRWKPASEGGLDA